MQQSIYPERPILLVDDEPMILLSFSTILRNSGINNFRTIKDSREVMQTLENQPVSAIVLDLSMPHISGIELLGRINESYPEILVIVATATDDIETAVACMRSGAFGYLVKPVEMNQFISTIRQALDTSLPLNEVSSIDKESRLVFLEATVQRLLRERIEWENKAYRLENKIAELKTNSNSVSDNTAQDKTFLRDFGELVRPFIHDIGRPLQAVEGWLRYLTSALSSFNIGGEHAIKVDDILSKCNEELKYIKRLTSKLSALSGKNPEIFSAVNINALICDTIHLVERRYPEITIGLEIDDSSLNIQADASSLEQIITNLAVNAAEACKERSAANYSPRIIIITKLSIEGKSIIIEIKDNGIGMQPDVTNHIYNLHYTTKKTGFGIGLYLTKKAVELHKGEIMCESTPYKGTSFIVTLPILMEDDNAA